MITKLLSILSAGCTVAILSGCGDTTIVRPTERTTETKVKISDDGSKKTTKETIVRENPDGTATKIEKKTETKVKTDDDTIVKLPGIEIKKQ